jgi:glycosyltransferase involved in cell wall biosynthesis
VTVTTLKANIVHRDLNICGGGEGLSLTVMQAIYEMGIEFEITTFEKPNMLRLENSYGKEAASVVQKARNINVISSALSEQVDQIYTEANYRKRYDITINTHGDALPYYNCHFSKNNSLTQCHFPTAKYHIDSQDEQYLKETRVLPIHNGAKNTDITATDSITSKTICFQRLKNSYLNLMRNSVVLTNSEFSKKAILQELEIEALVLSPPVEIEPFRNKALLSDHKDNIVLVLARVVPYKKIENAIAVAKILKKNNIAKGMKIMGNLYDDDFVVGDYYYTLIEMVKDYDLADYISIEINVNIKKVIEVMRHSKVYLHTAPGESFGISTVQAMSAGLIPVVPDVGGHTEFVPRKYHFHNIEEASEIISYAMNTPLKERIQISDSVTKFSTSNYIRSFQQLVKNLRSA